MKAVTKITNLTDIARVNAQLITLTTEVQAGKVFECEIRDFCERRSLDANAYVHVLWGKMAEVLKTTLDEIKYKMNLDYGTPDSEDGVEIILPMLSTVNPQRFGLYAKRISDFTAKNGQQFTQYLIYKPTHLLDTKEMSALIDGVVTEAKELGIETKTPAEIANMLSLWETKGGIK